MTEEKILAEVKPFCDACDKMIASKFIMIDKRISDVLKAVADCKLVFDEVKQCMINFSFDREWKLATAKVGVLTPPEEGHKFVAFVFSLLTSIDNQKISTSELLSKYYSRTDDNKSPYNQFCEHIILGFKNTILAILIGKETPKPKKAVEVKKTASVSSEVLDRLAFLAKDLKSYVQGLKKLKKSQLTKSELLEVISTFIMAINNGDVKYVKPFLLAIKSGKGKDKEIERRLVEITDIVNTTFKN